MKKNIFGILVLSGLLFASYWYGEKQSKNPAPNICLAFEDATSKTFGFGRCETNELICYVSKGAQTCYPKQAPAPQPVPVPSPTVSPKATK